jgi:hypothetical protein
VEDPAGDRIAGFGERLVFVKLNFFLLERAVKAFDATVAFGVIIRRMPNWRRFPDNGSR